MTDQVLDDAKSCYRPNIDFLTLNETSWVLFQKILTTQVVSVN